ncbi:3-hydroxybutyrate dehydrogenase [Alicyclobacillaceae bacterium I2511]|nr:3-hydroxybutyrate dehydrogenase [Alicyclobacillaceae bacterium I2511]
MNMDLSGRTAVVTGAASGLGLAIAQTLGRAGAQVVLSDLQGEAVAERALELQREGISALGVGGDAASEHDLTELVRAAQAFSANGGIEMVVNNAGTQHVANLEDFPVSKFRQIIDLMLIGPFMLTKLVFPGMKERGHGRIVNMSSINGLVGFAGKSAYNSAKHGLIGLTQVAALEGAEHGITVNAICPGYVDTPLVRNQLQDLADNRGVPLESVLEEVIYPLVPQKRLLSTDEIADYVTFLCSDAARGITGQAVVIDGGYLAQ